MRVFGIDPGSERTGYGCVETDGSRHTIVVCGAVGTPALAPFPEKLLLIHSRLTDNKNRTAGEIRHLLEKHGGNLAAPNAVAWMFHKRGYIVVEKSKADEDKLMGAVLDAGADDLQDDDENWEVFSAPEAFAGVQDAVKALGIEPATAKVSMIPQNYVKLEGKPAQQMIRLMEALDEHDDVQNVSSNFDISAKEIEASLA